MTLAWKKFNDKDGFKTCVKCFIVFPNLREFFHANCQSKDKLTNICKKCDNKRRTEAQKSRKYHNIPRRCNVCNAFFYASLAYMNKMKRKTGREGGVFCSNKCLTSGRDYRCFTRKGVPWNGKRRGINNPNNKYPIELIIKIKKLIKDGIRQVDISKEFKINQSYISSIKHKRAWASVEI